MINVLNFPVAVCSVLLFCTFPSQAAVVQKTDFNSTLLIPKGKTILGQGPFYEERKLLVPIAIILPDEYEKVKRRYPVVYFLPGVGGSTDFWAGISEVHSAVDRDGFIGVCLPEMNWYSNLKDKYWYEDCIVKEITPWVEKEFRTEANRQMRAVVGFSRGGYGAIKFALKYPYYFGSAAAFGGVIDFAQQDRGDANLAFGPAKTGQWRNDNECFRLAGAIKKVGKPIPRLFFSCGDKDPCIVANKNFNALLTERGIPHVFDHHDKGHEVPMESLNKALVFVAQGFIADASAQTDSR